MKYPMYAGTPSHLVSGTDGDVTGAAAVYSGECGYGFDVAFVRGDSIYAIVFRDPNPDNASAAPEVCSAAEHVGTAGWNASNPSMVKGDTRVYLVWEETNGTQHRVAFRERAGSIWSATVYLTHGTHEASKPVVGVDACGQINVLGMR